LCKSDDDACAYANMMMMLVLVRTMLANVLMFVLYLLAIFELLNS
jgi:hypothetical protein